MVWVPFSACLSICESSTANWQLHPPAWQFIPWLRAYDPPKVILFFSCTCKRHKMSSNWTPRASQRLIFCISIGTKCPNPLTWLPDSLTPSKPFGSRFDHQRVTCAISSLCALFWRLLTFPSYSCVSCMSKLYCFLCLMSVCYSSECAIRREDISP